VIEKIKLKDLKKNCHNVFKKIKLENDYSENDYDVILTKNKKDYKILGLSVFDPSCYSESYFFEVALKDFENKKIFYLNFICYTLSTLIVIDNKKQKWMLYPGDEIYMYMLDRLNIKSWEDLKNILLKGLLPSLLGGNPEKLNQKIKSLRKKYNREKKENLTTQSENSALIQTVGRLGDTIKSNEATKEVDLQQKIKEAMIVHSE